MNNQMQNQNQQVPPQQVPPQQMPPQQMPPQAYAQGGAPQAVSLFGNEKGIIIYNVGGHEVKLSNSIVRNYLTRGNQNVPDQDIVQFMQICRFNTLNPFIGEAYLVKYDASAPAQMVVSKEALMKRAEANEHYKGYKAGVIVKHKDGDVERMEGAFKLPDDLLLGGWAEVYRDDKDVPAKITVSMAEYDRNQSTWKKMPCTMIRKVAIAQAMREAFPIQLGAMYIPEEKGVPEDVPYEDVTDKLKKEIDADANGQVISVEDGDGQQKPANAPSRRGAKAQAQQQQQTPFDM